MAPTTPTISPTMKKYDVNDYPQLTSSRTTQSAIHATTPANTEEEFPSLASASKIKKPTTVKGGTAINFAAAAKKKGTAMKSNKSTHTKKAANKRQGYSMQKLKQPVHIPWLDTGSALNSIYLKEREQAIEYEMHTEASQRIFEQRSKHEAFIDLHGLHEDEALDIIEQRLHHLKSCYDGIIYIVTGTGHHSGANGLSKKTSKLKPSVFNYLTQENYRFAETNMIGDNRGGVYAVDLSC
ncbi:unnamed protein product [Mucor hiemalis]